MSEPAPYTAIQIADWFIARDDQAADGDMTEEKVQRLLYYAQGWHLAVLGEPLFDGSIEALVVVRLIPLDLKGQRMSGGVSRSCRVARST